MEAQDVCRLKVPSVRTGFCSRGAADSTTEVVPPALLPFIPLHPSKSILQVLNSRPHWARGAGG